MSEQYVLDDLDRSILLMMMKDASVAYTEIARILGVSGGTIHVRMNKMEQAGLIIGSKLVVSPEALGYDICAFLGIYLERGSAYKEALEQIRLIPEIIELHFTTGIYSMFAKLYCRDTKHLREVLNDKIQGIAGVQRTETFISLSEPIHRDLVLE